MELFVTDHTETESQEKRSLDGILGRPPKQSQLHSQISSSRRAEPGGGVPAEPSARPTAHRTVGAGIREAPAAFPWVVREAAEREVALSLHWEEALKEIDDVYEKYKSENDPVQKKRLQQHLQRALINSQELGDEKIQIVTQMLELVENRARQMETHSQCFQDMSENEKPLEKAKVESCQPERSSRRPRRQRTSESRDLCHIANGIDDCDDQPPKEKRSKSSKKKKRSKAKQEREVSPVEFAIDPNEPTYCLCNQVSYGEMIGCDNEQCPIEWFHFSCVGLTYKPKGKWYCPKCRGDNEKTMDKCTDKSKKDRRSR
ncbi:PREDICTED: inhibitor of growth protein 2 [Ficedula albicollis]|uniref:inhibitor of growth protein 2 n=1 Tax=Ficedula albicollis TaxID=59894 RepID=UPI0007AD8BFA|nr:PREDICTED: inhibitor of growth protein 2 [Ficedula albicollis]